MDEKAINKLFKKAIKIYSVILVILTCMYFLFFIIMDIEIETYKNIIYLIKDQCFMAGMFIFLPMIAIYTSRGYRYIKSKKNLVKSKEYMRDIEIKYSPAIISLILDLNTTIFKDYTAMILYLHWRKFIEIEIKDDEYKFINLNKNIEELNPHEQYIYRCIQGSSFQSYKFNDLVIEDAKNMYLITYMNGKINRTSKGKKEAVIWRKFKNYIHDYTLISEKNIEHIKVLEEYIPYAIALDEAKSIEKFISKNEKYRKLIYKN